MSAPPPPAHILRSHSAELSVFSFSDDNEKLYSGDTAGVVVVTSTRSLRPISSWKAHTDSLLGVEEWGKQVITHARDNKLHVWTCIDELPSSIRVGDSALSQDLPTPTLCYSMDVNALNYCRFSLLKLPRPHPEGKEERSLLALPNLVESSAADIWSLPSRQRLHAAVGQEPRKSIFSSEPGGRPTSGIIMSLHLFSVPSESPRQPNVWGELRLLCAYENGGVTLRRYTRTDKPTSVEGAGWEIIWNVKLHFESIMAMRVSRANELALTVSADHLVGRYELSKAQPASEACVAYRIKNPGNGAIAIRDDGKICAIGRWDGAIRLYTTRTFRPLGTLKYHRTGCRAVEFARSIDITPEKVLQGIPEGNKVDDDEMTEDEKVERARWLVGGGKDNRVSIWSLMSFNQADKSKSLK